MRAEVSRRLVHALGAVVPLSYVADVAAWGDIRLLVAIGIVAALTIEVLRLFARVEVPGVGRLIRGYEEEYVAGYALYLLGGGAVALAFDPDVAVPALLMLTLGDPIAGLLTGESPAIIGDPRRLTVMVKRVRVLAVMFALCLAFGLYSLDPPAAAAAATVATAGDGLKPAYRGYVLDDNLSIPIGAALAAVAAMELATAL